MNDKVVILDFLLKLNKIRKECRLKENEKNFINLLENILKNNKTLTLFPEFFSIEKIFDFCNTDKYAKGCILDVLLKHHSIVIYTKPYNLMNPNNYVDSFIKFDIIATQIPDVCIDYYKDKMNFDYPFERLLCAQKYLDYAITPNIGFPISRTALNVGSMIKKNEIEQFFEIIKNTNKDYNKIKIALSNHNYYAEVYSFLQNKLAFSKTEAEDIIINYIIDPSLTEVKKRKLEELKKLIDEVLIKEEENRLKIVDFYIDLLTFWEKDTKTIEDYKLLVEKLLLNDISSELVESLLYYYLQNEKNEMKKESKKSKKQIKRELAMYYEEDKNLPFDYHNLGKLLKLLQESNYADSVKITILNGIWQNKIENEAYYAYLLEKNRWNKTEKEKTKEIEEILELMCYAENKEEWEYYHDEALKICATLDSSVACMDYEMNLMRKK